MFGQFIKETRLALEMTLREFCRKLKEDPSNWSKIERGILGPPRDKNKLNKIATVLHIKKGSPEWENLFDYANIDSGNIPDYIMSDKEILNSLPAFFRTIGSVKPTLEEVKELVKKFKEEKQIHEL